MAKWKRFLQKQEKLLMTVAAAAGLTASLLHFDFSSLESGLYDFRVSKSLQKKADANILLVTVDDDTTKALDEFSPLSLDFHALFLEQIEKSRPAAIGYLVDINQVNQAKPELMQSEWSDRFIGSAGRLQARGIPVILGTQFDVTGEVMPPYPLSALPHSLAVIHRDGNVFGEDKVTRRALIEMNGKPAFHVELASQLGLVRPENLPGGVFSLNEIDAKYFFFRYHGDTAPGKHGQLPYPRISFHEILRNQVPAERLEGKILLVGTLSKENPSDFAYTPYSRMAFTHPKLVVHANILDSVIHRDGIIRLPKFVNAAVTFFSTLFVIWAVLSLMPLYGVFASLGVAFFVIIAGLLLYQHGGIWLRESQPLVGILIGYYLAVPYRLVREYRKRWEYQRKNEILTQVEELKTNFLNLVTHDLKTPVARIQGLAEVLLRKASDRLIDRDKETVHTIIGSTEELNHFISSILELSKVEGQKIQLRRESKDINDLIERCVKLFQASSKAKGIRIRTDLEPLFPVRIDSNLMSKVLNNLIDNALKYSPAETEVVISSKEINGWIEVAVCDQGIGMSDTERESLFTRFYRAKNDTTVKIAGTGLGLYLTRFFVEAHGGRVDVQSEPNNGSIFKILLPLETPSQETATVEPAAGLRRNLSTVITLFSKKES